MMFFAHFLSWLKIYVIVKIKTGLECVNAYSYDTTWPSFPTLIATPKFSLKLKIYQILWPDICGQATTNDIRLKYPYTELDTKLDYTALGIRRVSITKRFLFWIYNISGWNVPLLIGVSFSLRSSVQDKYLFSEETRYHFTEKRRELCLQ